MEPRGRAASSGAVTSPESAVASELFDQFVSAGTFKSVLFTYRQICDVLRLKPTVLTNFYPRLKTKLHSWRAASLWTKIDKRASHKCYNRGKACPNTRVLIIGAGPCGLRVAIEAQLLGAKVVLLEKRDRFSRNNVLHLWPFVIHDLRSLGAKKFFGKFCAGSIDHISIRQLQLILLKVALLLGVEVHENVGFESLIEPPEDQTSERIGWHARVSPPDHPVSQYEFDVLIGADGKRNTLLGFNRKEFRGKLAIAVTANFINRHTIEEARVPEISGVAFIFNQKFFQDMREETAIDLENIVYYKDDTHYFVMTAKKQSLLERRVIIRDYNDTARLLAPENVDRQALMEYARDAADFATNYQLPHLDFAVNHYGQADVAMFDFTSMYAAENACRIIEKRGHKLLQGLVGDSLLEPFWPTGSGCGRGFLSSFDTAWMVRSWASGKLSTLQVLAERESIYRLLAQTTPENLSKDLNQYTLNPSSRYPNLNLQAVLPSQVRSLYDTDGKLEESILDVAAEMPKKKKRKESMIHPDTLLNWCQKQVALNEKIRIQDFTSSWKNGLALCAILHRYRPDLIDVTALDPENIAKNNQLAFDICERELGISPVMTGQEMADCAVPDKLTMVSYISQVYESFRGEIPAISYSKCHVGEERTISPSKQHHGTPLAVLNRISNRLQNKRKYSIEKESKDRERGENIKKRSSLLTHKRRSRDKSGISSDLLKQDVILTDYQSLSSNKPRESINTRVKNLEEKLKRDAGLRCHLVEESESSKASRFRSEQTELSIKMLQEQLQRNGSENVKKARTPKVGKLRKDEWNVKIIEEKSKLRHVTPKKTEVEKPKIHKEIFISKLNQMDEKLKTGVTSEELKYRHFDEKLNQLSTILTKGNLETGEKGHNQTAAMTEHMSTIWERKVGQKKDPLPPAPVSKTSEIDSSASTAGSQICYFCKKHVYLVERSSAEGLFFHRSCLKCEYCGASLRRGNYSFDRDGFSAGKFYCTEHFRKQKPDLRMQEIMKRKEAFLSCALEEKQKETLYKTLLDNTEKALSPNKQVESASTPAKDVPSPAELKPEKFSTPNLLTEPANLFGRDQTPERVEYENSIMEMSEEELLTSELEEEELTQKNLGPSQDLATSEDEYSDLSTDSESDEEAFAEELERSLTADETRKLAETWNKKYSAEHPLIESNSTSSSSADDEGSETEIGSDTSDDIDSDAEYSETSDNQKDKEPEMSDAQKSLDIKYSFNVEVPVLDLKSMNRVSDDDTSTESDVSEDIDSGDVSEGESGTEVDSESEPAAPLPPPQIPTIIIHESPPQDVDLDQNWEESQDSNSKSATADILPEGRSLTNQEQLSDAADKPVVEGSKPSEAPAKESNAALVDGKFGDMDKNFDFPSFRADEDLSEKIVLEEGVVAVAPLAMEESSSDVSISSGVNTLAKDIVTDVIEAAKESVSDHPSREVKTETKPGLVNVMIESSSTDKSTSCDELEKSENYSVLNSMSSDDDEKVHCGKHSPDNFMSGKSDSNVTEIEDVILPVNEVIDENVIEPHGLYNVSKISTGFYQGLILESEDSVFDILADDFCKTPKFKNDVLGNDSDNVVLETSMTKEFLDNSPELDISKNKECLDSTLELETSTNKEFLDNSLNKPEFNETFVTMRKHENSVDDIIDWDVDDDVPLPPCFNTNSFAENADCASVDGIFRADVTHNVESESVGQVGSRDTNIDDDLPNMSVEQKNIDTFVEHKTNVPVFKIAKNSIEMLKQSSEALNFQAAKISASVPKRIIVLPAFPVKAVETEVDPIVDEKQLVCDVVCDRTIEKSLSKPLSPTNSNSKSSKDCSPKEEVKHKGYSGSFAEKVRPKSLFCDSLYLRSLDIKLKQPFSSLNKSDDKLDEYSKEKYESDVKKKLFSLSDDSLDVDDNDVFENIKPVVCAKTSSSANINKPRVAVKHSSVSFSPYESRSDLVSPYTSAQVSVSENSFPKNMQAKCDIDVGRLRQKREKRKSVHEDIQGLPFADEDKIVSPVEPLPNSDVFMTPRDNLDSKSSSKCSDSDVFYTPAWKGPDLVDEERYLRLQSTAEQERARQEARARARLKSDEELGLSPNNYRKKYRRQLSLNSINYDELCGDEFCDQDDEMEDDVISNFNFGLKKATGIEETFSKLKNSDIIFKGKPLEISSSQKSQPKNNFINASPVSSPPKTEKVLSASTDTLKCCDESDQMDSGNNTSLHSMHASSPETSPEVCAETPPCDSKFNSKTKCKTSRAESSEEDKSKPNGKKSIFSILNFGKGNVSKEKPKQKSKDSHDKELSSSLPNDFGARSISKSKPFSHLKLSKSKEKSGKPKVKPVPSEEVVPLDSNPAQEEPLVSFSTQQAKIIPKYTVYRNPETMISTFPVHLPVSKLENGLAPKASEDSFSDDDDTKGNKAGRIPSVEKNDKNSNEKDKKTQRIVQKVQRQQVLKRLRTAQEIQRRLEELEVEQKELEQHGVMLEKTLRLKKHDTEDKNNDSDLLQEWSSLLHTKNKLMREEQELVIRLKDLELEDRHSKLQQDMRERMAQTDLKDAAQIKQEREILSEMLEIVEKRDELVVMLDQLRLREVEEEKNLQSDILSKGMKSPLSPSYVGSKVQSFTLSPG